MIPAEENVGVAVCQSEPFGPPTVVAAHAGGALARGADLLGVAVSVAYTILLA